jgi:hypothetical protein
MRTATHESDTEFFDLFDHRDLERENRRTMYLTSVVIEHERLFRVYRNYGCRSLDAIDQESI